MTELLFRDDAYLRSCEAQITAINERGGILLDRTLFYATGGGQPGDNGQIEFADGSKIDIATTVFGETKSQIVHVPAENQRIPEIGESVVLHVDWQKRYRYMRAHTALHLLSVAVPFPVTGGQISKDGGRLDFDIPEAGLDKEEIAEKTNDLIAGDHGVSSEWITDEELAANPGLVKTMSVKPPMGSGRVRLVRIGDSVDLQPCGGTHVLSTLEIGKIGIPKIEKKGRQNRRVRLALID
ncbi:MAG: alanyl-tRNA editing protein [Stappiaceae bacterium]